MSALPSGGGAVMNRRVEPTDSLDDFPTPPWATRALIHHVLRPLGLGVMGARIWEPAAGRGIMAGPLREAGARVFASDVFAYPDPRSEIDAIGSFVGDGPDVLKAPPSPYVTLDYVITNPPFRLAVEFFERAISEAAHVAFFCRANWAEGKERYERIFAKRPPLAVANFVERVPIVRGRYDPGATTMTSYAWFVWSQAKPRGYPRAMWIPPCADQLTLAGDARRYASPKPATEEHDGSTQRNLLD
ncbi:MAG: hypothetical protein NW206_19650 [Hyphomonadaceae bacterium]|nr:hypothetical protein [Hyphomonadaceae bacterium]